MCNFPSFLFLAGLIPQLLQKSLLFHQDAPDVSQLMGTPESGHVWPSLLTVDAVLHCDKLIVVFPGAPDRG